MVRINLIDPKKLSDQHLIAEYNEILKALGYIRNHPNTDNIPKQYGLGWGHITFFKNKVTYLKNRFEKLKVEMKRRGFKPKVNINMNYYSKDQKKNWRPSTKDKKLVKERIVQKLEEKPNFYRYYGEYKKPAFFKNLLRR